MRYTLVSAADRNYFGLLQGLVLSCREREEGRGVPISVLDLGMEEAQLAWLARHGVRCVRPGWDFDFPERETTPATFRAQTARPFLPRYFPGYDLLLWMDADTWVQEWSAVEAYLAAAEEGAMAITPEVDRCYNVTFDTPHALGRYASWKSVYGPDAAKRYGVNPTINSGVFALRRDAPHWALWQEELGRALQRTRSFYIEQFTLNYVLYARDVPSYFLPAPFNWITWHATPLLTAPGGVFVEPRAPFSPIGIMHLTGDVKRRQMRVSCLDGSETERTLEYPRRGEEEASAPA